MTPRIIMSATTGASVAVVIAASAKTVTAARRGGGADDPANHNVGDDRGQRGGGHGADDTAKTVTAARRGGGADDPANHNVGDDRGQRGGGHGADDTAKTVTAARRGGGADDPANHNVGDDRGQRGGGNRSSARENRDRGSAWREGRPGWPRLGRKRVRTKREQGVPGASIERQAASPPPFAPHRQPIPSIPSSNIASSRPGMSAAGYLLGPLSAWGSCG